MTNAEIDRRVEVEVMGWQLFPYAMPDNDHPICRPDVENHVSNIRTPPPYSTNRHYAMDVVEKIRAHGQWKLCDLGKEWCVMIYPFSSESIRAIEIRHYHESLPMAISLAALAWAEAKKGTQ